jgi:hypothetical protein
VALSADVASRPTRGATSFRAPVCSGAEGRDDVLGGELDIETLNGETTAGDTNEERRIPRAGYERAVLDQSTQIAAVELASAAPLDRADKVDLIAPGQTTTADEVDLDAAVAVRSASRSWRNV